ncbi:MAG: hypothetical protein EBZ46_08685, partial [Actinobacteria bacterium]|nr:hypothetical protein [Actinomycetota bacterium]
AAPQIGVQRQVFVYDIDEERKVILNPQIVESSERRYLTRVHGEANLQFSWVNLCRVRCDPALRRALTTTFGHCPHQRSKRRLHEFTTQR